MGANDLASLKQEIEIMESDTEESKMGVMEWSRLKNLSRERGR